MNKPLLITPEQAAQMLGIGRSKLYAMAARGEVPAVRVGSSVRFSVAALQRWVNKLSSGQRQRQ